MSSVYFLLPQSFCSWLIILEHRHDHVGFWKTLFPRKDLGCGGNLLGIFIED